MTDNYYNISANETAEKLGGDIKNGLTDKEAAKRLQRNGRKRVLELLQD